MSEAATGPSGAMISAISELWRLRSPGPDNILGHPAFERLREACCDGYPNAGKRGPAFALSNALRALGLPCGLRKETAHLSLPIEDAAKGLDAAIRATSAKRIHLVPLDLADDLPSIAFGPAKLGRLTADELRLLVDETTLKRLYPRQDFDAERFSQFHWLVVEETVALNQEPEARAVPVLFMNLSEDLGQIEPHKARLRRRCSSCCWHHGKSGQRWPRSTGVVSAFLGSIASTETFSFTVKYRRLRIH